MTTNQFKEDLKLREAVFRKMGAEIKNNNIALAACRASMEVEL